MKICWPSLLHSLLQDLRLFRALTKLIARQPRIAGILDNLGREQNQEFSPVTLVARRFEQIPEDLRALQFRAGPGER
jgi:hypothetical protein